MAKRSARAEYVVGVDVGGTKILAAVVDERRRILAREKKSTHPERGVAAVIDRIADCVHDALAAAALSHTAIRAVGVGVPGLVDNQRGLIRVAPNLQWENVPLARQLRARLDIPVTLINDVQAGTLAVQQCGSGRGLTDFVCMFIGTGIGGGLVIRGQLYRGPGNMAGEIGHMVVVPEDGRRCGCGNYGCLETVASRSAIVREIVTAIHQGRRSIVTELCDGNLKRIRSRIIAAAYREGDKLVRKVIHQAADYLGIGVANLINVLNPQAVILGGGLIEAMGERLIPRITKAAMKHVIAASADRVRICDSGLGDDAGIIGAALAAQTFSTSAR